MTDAGPATDRAAPATGGATLSWSRLDDHVLLGDSGQAMAMVAAGAVRLVDLRAETTPPRFDVPVDHFPLEDLLGGQEDAILGAARHVRGLATAGVCVGIYCQAGVSRTAAVAIAYLMLVGDSLPDATARVRAVRPQALPALELYRSLEELEHRITVA